MNWRRSQRLWRPLPFQLDQWAASHFRAWLESSEIFRGLAAKKCPTVQMLNLIPTAHINNENSLQFIHSVLSDSLRPHEPQHTRPPCPLPTPGVHSDSTSIESVMPSSHLILCCPLLLPPSILPSIRVFSNESVHRIRWPKYWSFSFNINPPNEHLGLISFRIDWLDLLAVQGTLKSPPTPQFKSISSSARSFLYSPTLVSIHDYWKNHSFA